MNKPLVSFVVACYMCEKSLAGIVDVIAGSLDFEGFDLEVVLVDDGSSDATFEEILRLSGIYPFVKGVRFSKNFGQASAILAGLRECRGDFVVYCDDDGQSPVAEVMCLINAMIDEERDMIFAAYRARNGGVIKRFGSFVNDFMLKVLLDKPMRLELGNLWVARRFVIDEVCKCNNPFLHLSGLFLRITNNIGNIEMKRGDTSFSATNYTFRKLMSLWLNGATAFSLKPLRFVTLIGCLTSILGFIGSSIIIVQKLLNPTVQTGWPSLVCIILFLFGVLFVVLGVLGEYLGRIYLNVGRVPQYVVKEVVGDE